MKKLAVLSLLVISLVSCKKNNEIEKSSTPVSSEIKTIAASLPTLNGVSVTQEGYLRFNTKEDYERIMETLTNASDEQLDRMETTLKFTSGYTYFGIKSAEERGVAITDPLFKNSIFFDEMILRFTDKNGIFQVGDYIFKLELDNGYILQMYEKDKKPILRILSKAVLQVRL